MPPDQIAKYEIKREIASGSQGAVYLGFDPFLKMDVAVKVLHSSGQANADTIARFQREAKLIQAIDHENVVQIFDAGFADGVYFIALEFIPQSLDKVIEAEGALTPDRAVALAIGISEGIGQGHAQGIVHRDIKPQNVLLTEDGIPKVTDFGIARDENVNTMTKTGTLMGTVYYMSPEQVSRDRADARSDVFSLACLLYQLLTGEVPFNGDSQFSIMRSIVDDLPEPLTLRVPAAPLRLIRIIEQAMSKDPSERFENGHAFALALRNALPSAVALIPSAAPDAPNERTATTPTHPEFTPSPSGVPPVRPPLEDAAYRDLSDSLVNDILDLATDRPSSSGPTDVPTDADRTPVSDATGLSQLDEEILEQRIRNVDDFFSHKSRLTAAILALLFGGFGAHRFYLGKSGSAVTQIFFTVVSFGILGIWGFIEGLVLMFGGGGSDSNNRPLKPHDNARPQRWTFAIGVILAIIAFSNYNNQPSEPEVTFAPVATAQRAPTATPAPAATAAPPSTATAQPAPTVAPSTSTPIPIIADECISLDQSTFDGFLKSDDPDIGQTPTSVFFFQTNCRITGPLEDLSSGTPQPLIGTISQNEVNFTVTVTVDEGVYLIDFTGSYQSGTINGTYIVPLSESTGTFSLTSVPNGTPIPTATPQRRPTPVVVTPVATRTFPPTPTPTPPPTAIPTPQPAVLKLEWTNADTVNITNAVEGEQVWLHAVLEGVPDSEIPVDVYEVDPFNPDDLVVSGELEVINGQGWAFWDVFWEEDELLGFNSNPEYKFVVMGVDSPELAVAKAVAPTPTPVATQPPLPTPTRTPTPTPVPTPKPSVLSFSHPSFLFGVTGETINLQASFVSSSIPGEALTGRMDWGDGTGINIVPVIAATGEYVSEHIFVNPGIFTVRLIATNDAGQTFESTFTVSVNNP
jgi:serine/threonine protein kinase